MLVDLLGEHFGGVLGSDRWSAYGWQPPERRQVCWAHLKREFQGLADWGGRVGPVGEEALALTERLFRVWHEARAEPEVLRERMAPVQAEFRALLEREQGHPAPKVAGLCRNLLKLWPALWLFVRVPGVEPTNNAAERALRPAVLWRKGSFGTRSPEGSVLAARMLSVTATCRQQGCNVVAYLTAVCQAAQVGRPVPSLLAHSIPS